LIDTQVGLSKKGNEQKMTSKETKPIAAVAIYCGVCGYYIISKDCRTSAEHRMTINNHIKIQHKDAKLNLWRSPFNMAASMKEAYLEDFATEAAAKSWQAGAKKIGWKGTSELDPGSPRRT
jgi:hypothetical protein